MAFGGDGGDAVEGRLVWALAAASAVAAAFAGCHPTATPVVDPLYAAAFAGVVTLAGAAAARGTLLWLAALAVGLSRSILLAPAAAGLVVAFGGAWRPRPSRVLGALTGALTVQVVLRWPGHGFHGATALLAAAATAPVLLAAAHAGPPALRRWLWRGGLAVTALAVVLAVPVAVGALATHGRVNRGIVATESALRSVSDGRAASGTQQLATATANFSSAARLLGAWWTAGARLVPVVAQQRQAVAGGVQVARDVTAAAGLQAARIDFGQLHYQNGRLDLARLQALGGPLQVVAGQLTTGVRRLASLRSGWLVEPVASRVRLLDTQVVKAQQSAALAVEAVAAAPSLLGGAGPRHYFVALMDPAESRGLGGLIASYGELTAAGGRITLDTFADIGQLNSQLAARGGGHLTGPAAYLARYGSFRPQARFQDLTYSPDLPTVTDVIGQLYAEAGNTPIDGVLVLDPRSLAALLTFTGPIDVPGLGQLTAGNAAAVLTTGQYAVFPSPAQQSVRRAALHEALRLAVQRLAAGTLPGPRSLADTLSPLVRRGDLLFWSTRPGDQPLLQRVGLAGGFPQPAGGDVLGVVTQNAANNKVDAYLQRSISDQVRYDPSTGHVSATVTIGLHNQAPATGLPAEVIGSFAGSGLPPGTNETWLSVYTPLGLAGASVDGQSLPLTEVPELGVDTFSGYVRVPPGATVTVVVQLDGRLAHGSSYRLALYQQPLVVADRDEVRVTAGSGWRLRSTGSWVPGPSAVARRDFSFHRNG